MRLPDWDGHDHATHPAHSELTMALAAPIDGLLDVPLGTPARPRWRGLLHQWALFTALPMMALLVALADGTKARVAVIVYAIGLCSMFAASTTYHRWVHTLTARRVWQRRDHAMIYAAIAGSFTPVCVLAMPSAWGVALLVFIWSGAVVGAVLKLAVWHRARIIGAVLYMALSWVGVASVPFLWSRYGAVPVVLLLAGGVAYTTGAIGFARQWPRLSPAVFSYHEVWHAFTIVAAALQWGAVWTIAT
jgi:hemolysin III